MASKDELQNVLKEKYSINKNISQSLTKEECEKVLSILGGEPGAVKLIESFAQKNSSLGRNNAYFSRLRNQAENKFESLQVEYSELEKSIKTLESSKITREDRKKQLEQEREKLEKDIQDISSKNTLLSSKVQTLTFQNDELTEVNTQLKKDNKDLKNTVDLIRLRLARDTKTLLQYEDSEIRNPDCNIPGCL